jgi:hypothetical protein
VDDVPAGGDHDHENLGAASGTKSRLQRRRLGGRSDRKPD